MVILTHTILSSLEKDDLKYEIKHCLKKIAKELDQDILHFSYPEGQAHHYNDEVIKKFLKKMGLFVAHLLLMVLMTIQRISFILKELWWALKILHFHIKSHLNNIL